MTLLAVVHVLRQNGRVLDGISSLVSSFLGPPPNRSLADACVVESMLVLDLLWEASCTTKAGRKQKWTLTNYLRSEAHYSKWEFTNAAVAVARKGNVQKLEWLLAHFRGYEVEDSVVEEAAKFGHLNVLQLLHRHCSVVNGPTILENDRVAEKVTYNVVVIWGADTLLLGSESGYVDIVQWLVERTTSIDELTANKLFADAGRRGDIALLEWLVARSLTYDECFVVRSASSEALEWIVARCSHSDFFPRSSEQEVNDFLNEAARSAARVGRVDILENLLSIAQIYCDDKLQKFYCSALDEACRHGQLAVVEWEISHEQRHEGDSHFEVTLSTSVLDDAASNGHLQIAKLLCDRYDVRMDNLPVTMFLAAANGHLEVVEWLCNKFGDQRLFHSRQHGASLGLPWDLETFHLGDLAMTSNILNNPLKNLARITSVRPATAMDAAAMFGHLEVLRFLRSIRSVRGITHAGGDLPTITLNAMNGAAALGHLDVMKWLYENERARCSCQALISAASNQRFDIVEWLIENRPGTFVSDVIFVALAASAPTRAVDWMKTHPIENASFIWWVVSVNGRLQILQLLHEKLSWDRSCYTAAFGGAIYAGAFDVLLYLESKCVEDGIADVLMPGVRDQLLADMALPATIKSWIRGMSPVI